MIQMQIDSTIRSLEWISEVLPSRTGAPESVAFAAAVVALALLSVSTGFFLLREAVARLPRIPLLAKIHEPDTGMPGPPPLRTAIALLGGFTVLAPPLAASAQTASSTTDEDVPSMHLIEMIDVAEATAPSSTSPQSTPSGSVPSPTTLPRPDGESQMRPPTHSNLLPEFATAVPTPEPLTTPEYWTVEPGDCLWDIAVAVRAQQLSRPATGSETVDYLNLIIEANRHVLADPDRPDLIHPGQSIRLPKA
jgi:nucleoid-associated protein YgaU